MCARGHVRRHNTLSRHLKLVFVCEEKGGKLFYETYALLEGCCISLIRGGGGGEERRVQASCMWTLLWNILDFEL